MQCTGKSYSSPIVVSREILCMNKYRSVGLEPEGLVKESYHEQLGGGRYKLFTPVHIQYYSPTVVLSSGSCGNISFEARASTCKVELSTAKRAGSMSRLLRQTLYSSHSNRE